MASGVTKATLRPHDPLDLDSLLGDEELMVRDTVRRWVGERICRRSGSGSRRGSCPASWSPRSVSSGLFGMHLQGYGCAGASATAYGVACRELEAGDSGLRSLVSVQGSLAMFPIWKYGSEEQKQQWLPRMAAGEAVGCFGLTEPDFGSDPVNMRTRARRDGDDWVLNGTKMWITNGGIADVAVVWAQTDDGVPRLRGPDRRPRGSPPATSTASSPCAPRSRSELILEDVRLPDSAALPGVTGMRGPLSCLSEARYGICWGAVGARHRLLPRRAATTPRPACNTANRSPPSSSPSASSST